MQARPGPYELLSRLLEYPDVQFPDHLQDCLSFFPAEHPEAAQCVNRFAEQVRGLPLTRLQELFTQTFDLNPVCSLEVGWQLYGEEYSRGSFLVSMRGQLRRYGIAESCELPDHLTHLLPLLDRMERAEWEAAQQFAKAALLPALEKMLRAFGDKDTPWKNILQAIDGLLHERHECRPAEVSHG